MKPYQIEIFDRSFNFKYNYLVDASDFEYSEDALDPEKNTIVVPTDFRAKALVNVPDTAPKGWFIRIIGNKHEFQGVITDLTEEESQSTITYSNLLSLFDLNTIVSITAITQTTVESFIKEQLVAAFVSNSDASQLLTGLSAGTISVTTTTTGTLAFTSTDDPYVSIHLINDLIVDAFNTYGIFTSISLNFAAKTINVSIGKVADSTFTIEGDLPNISDATFTIRASDKEVNKVVIWDDERGQQIEYYLHPNGTFDTNNTNRITPVVNKVIIIHAETLGEAKVNDKYNVWIDAFKNYAERDADLNDAELAELKAAAANMNSLFAAYKNFYPLGVTATSTTNPNIPMDYTGYFDLIYANGTSREGSGSEDDPELATMFSDFTFLQRSFEDYGYSFSKSKLNSYWGLGNAVGVFDISPSRVRYIERWTYHWQSVQNGLQGLSGTDNGLSFFPVNGNDAQHAYNVYKDTIAWRNEVEIAVTDIFNTTAQQKATETFANNKYSNLIELTVNSDDLMINPHNLKMGQVVNVIHNGKSYNSILSGRKVSNGKVELIFGTIRLELTKFLKGRY